MNFEEKIATVIALGFPAADAQEWAKKHSAHVGHAAARGLRSELTFQEYVTKAAEAGLQRPAQVGLRVDDFVLARIGDVGDYTSGNCRFITGRQNQIESVENGRRAIAFQKASATMTGRTKDTHAGIKAQAEKLSKRFLLNAPDGMEHRGINVSEFCKANGLNVFSVYDVFSGRRKHHKGWTGQYLDDAE
jgi:hypothetical protein